MHDFVLKALPNVWTMTIIIKDFVGYVATGRKAKKTEVNRAFSDF